MAETAALVSYKPQQNSRLLSLTPELRNCIYHSVFCISDEDDMVVLAHLTTSTKSSVLAILQTCRQILNEAEALFFHLNHFTLRLFSDPEVDLHTLSASLAPRRLASIRNITIMVPIFGHPVTILWQLSKLNGLRTVRLVVYERHSQRLAAWALEALDEGWTSAISEFSDLSFVQDFSLSTSSTDDTFVAGVAKWDTRLKALIRSTQET
ncbi:hypothetical protein LTR56_014380 [Elasticomyces elasticus]|nr:hypothetical protein LTR22_023896 [Elasticomyces elasticus]KAK3636004.1 hypothetical protein LTR56_014380 [Elasticomyces elasticus]KAK4916647.1 hypothetical protein LTR49_015345 [Elasticomyces elasticus]